MSAARRNLVWPVLIIGIGVLMFLISTDVIPEAIGDLMIRSWPVLLIMFGLNILLAGRLRYANWLVFGLSIALVVILGNLAYDQREDEYRTDNTVALEPELLPPNIQRVNVRLNLEQTRATISQAAAEEQIAAYFEGSNESELDMQLEFEGDTAIMTIDEERPGILPNLSEVGRGTLNVFLPGNVSLGSIEYVSEEGPLTVDLRQLSGNDINLDIHLMRGNMDLYLPLDGLILTDAIRIDSGNLRMIIPPDTNLLLDLGDDDQLPEYVPEDSSRNYIRDSNRGVWTIESRDANGDWDVLLSLNIDGQITMQHTGE